MDRTRWFSRAVQRPASTRLIEAQISKPITAELRVYAIPTWYLPEIEENASEVARIPKRKILFVARSQVASNRRRHFPSRARNANRQPNAIASMRVNVQSSAIWVN